MYICIVHVVGKFPVYCICDILGTPLYIAWLGVASYIQALSCVGGDVFFSPQSQSYITNG